MNKPRMNVLSDQFQRDYSNYSVCIFGCKAAQELLLLIPLRKLPIIHLYKKTSSASEAATVNVACPPDTAVRSTTGVPWMAQVPLAKV